MRASAPATGKWGRQPIFSDAAIQFCLSIKFLGEGEWKRKKHGAGYRRQWRKVHLAIDAHTLDIRAIEVTDNGTGDAPLLPELLSQLAYKASWYGRTFWQAPKNFASSKLCHACGTKNTELTLSQRRWRCVCGVEHDRDTNAARNLLLAGLAATQFGTAGLAGR